MPPWKKTSMFGQTSCRCFLPESSITRTKTDNIHDGTPERLVMFFESVSCAIRSRFTSKSLNNATSFEGTRTRLAKGFIFSIRIALKSPTSELGRL